MVNEYKAEDQVAYYFFLPFSLKAEDRVFEVEQNLPSASNTAWAFYSY